MKKIFSIILISICTIVMISGCNKNISDNDQVEDNGKQESQEIIKIMENVYVDYINEIYLDSNNYVGKTIEIEGMFNVEKDDNGKNHMYVYRLTDINEHVHEHDEEHIDGDEEEHTVEMEVMMGFEFDYNGNLPQKNDWIKVVGELKEIDGDLIISADSVEIMEDRGLEKVKEFY